MYKKSFLGQKLNLLLFQRGMKAMDLARELDIPQPTLHRILSGKSKKPHKETLDKIAIFFNLDSTKLIENTDDFNEQAINLIPSYTHAIPLFTLQKNKLLNEMIQEASKTLVVTNTISEKAFGIILTDESLLPIFDEGSILIFDPQRSQNVRNYVLVSLGNTGNYIIRQLLTDGENQFLKPLNPDIAKFSTKVLEEQDKIIGTLVEARQSYL